MRFLWVLIVVSAGCADEGSGTEGSTAGGVGGGEAGGGEAGGGQAEGEGRSGPPALSALTWQTHEVVAVGETGGQIRMAFDPAGGPGVAYLRPTGETLACELTQGEPFFEVTRREYDVVWSQRDAQGAWSDEVVAQTDVVHGLGLAYGGGGAAHLAFLGGEPGTQWCAGSDLMVARRAGGGWGAASAVHTDSATGTTCRKMQNVCNVGNVTGLWAALAVSADGSRVAVAFQDIHFGFAKEDWESADLELAVGPGGWAVETVHDSEGAGKWTGVAFGAEGKIALAWYSNKEGGVWFAAEDTGGEGGDTGWPEDPIRISRAEPSYPIQLAALPSGGYAAVYNDTREDQRGLWFAESPDGMAWTETPVDIASNTGRSPSMALDPWGRPVVAYGACNDANSVACDPQRDGVRLARWDGRTWSLTDVEGGDGSEAAEGSAVALALDSEGMPWVAFGRDRYDGATDTTLSELRVVRGR